MNAREARDKAQHVNISEINSQYAEVSKKITEAANKGEYQTHFYQYLKTDVQTKLQEEGFVVKSFSDQHNEATVTISW